MTRPTWTNLFYLGAGEFLARGLSFLAFAYLGRTLLASQFGTLGTALAVTMVATLVIDFGLGILGSREISKDRSVTADLARGVVGTQLILAVLVLTALLAASWVLPLEPELAALLRGLGASLLGVPWLLNWVFQGRNEMFWYAAPTVLRWLVFLIAALALVHAPEHITLLPVAEITAIGAAGVCFVYAFRRTGADLRPRIGWDRSLLRLSAPIGFSNLIWAVRMYLPVMVVYGVSGPESAGLFEAAHRIVVVFLALLGVYFTNLFPALSASSIRKGPGLVRLISRATQVSVAGAIALAAATFVAAPTMIRLVFGAEFVTPESTATLVVLTCLTPVLAARRAGRHTLIVLDRQQLELWCSVAGVTLLVALLFVLTPRAGAIGAAWAMWISEAAATALTWMVLVPRLRARQAVG